MKLREHSIAPTDDLIRFLNLKVKVTTGCRGGQGIHIDAGVSQSHLLVDNLFMTW